MPKKSRQSKPVDSGLSSTPSFVVKLVLDESGSMMRIKDKTISGTNDYINSLKNDPVTKFSEFSLTKFNAVEITNDKLSLVAKAALLDVEMYRPREGTPLFDAIGKSIRDLEDHLKDRKIQKVTFVIITDGEENSSKEYTFEAVKQLIAEKEKAGWVFVYLGANQNAWDVGSKYGFAAGNTITWSPDQVQDTYKLLANATRSYAASASVGTQDFWTSANKENKNESKS